MEGQTPARVFLTGMMGAGKTLTGRHLAEALGWRFIDLDAAIEVAVGHTVSDIFAQEGEEAFRRLERATLEAVLKEESDPGLIVALGGGTYTQGGVAQWLRAQGETVFIEVPPEVLAKRLSTPSEVVGRPLLADDPTRTLQTLLEARQSRYEQADLIVDGVGNPQAVAARILTALGEREMPVAGMLSVSVPLGDRTYPIWIDGAGPDRIAARLSLMLGALEPAPAKVAIVTDERVASLHLDALTSALSSSRWDLTQVIVPEGEKAKRPDHLQAVWTALLEARFGRRDVVVAFGGGVTGDLAGFAAATLLRGVRLIQVPTTVLAQVDSSVGGKTGINHDLGKNLIGAFHQPIGVIVGMGVLRTLEPRQVRSGLAEVVKYAVLEGEPLMGWLERDAEAIVAQPWVQGALVARCCSIKARIVAEDEREAGKRALLNLGHTFGHAIEAMEGFGGVTHGEAVGLGMVLAARAARVLGLSTDPDLEARLTGLLGRLKLPADPTKYLKERKEMAKRIGQDKKADGDAVTFILPVQLGQVVQHPLAVAHIPHLMTQLASTGVGI